jgi:hypothetical protein
MPALLLLTCARAAVAQPALNPAQLATQASVVVQGAIVRPQSSDEPLLASSSQTAVIAVRRMYAGGEFTGDLTGKTITVILSRPLDGGQDRELIFFGNPRYAGKSLTIADIAEVPATVGAAPADAAIARGVQARRDGPLVARLAIAAAVFTGHVESVSPLRAEARRGPSGDVDEHDPEYQLAHVRVLTAIRGAKAGSLVNVVFPASRDIMWFNVAKLIPGGDYVILGHHPQDEELARLRVLGVLPVLDSARALLTDEIFDVLPLTEEKRVISLETQGGLKQ